MRSFIVPSLLLAVLASAASTSAQQVTRLPEGTRQSVGLEGGLESGFVARASYVRRLDLGWLDDERAYARLTMPFVTPDFSDWALDGGVQASLLASGDLRLALATGPVLRNTSNDLFSATALGLGATALFGYEGARWGLSGELGYEQIVTTHLSHSDLYREVAHAGAKDGWYTITGSTTRAGLRGGVRVGAVEIAARLGGAATGHFQITNPPFYFTAGGSYAF